MKFDTDVFVIKQDDFKDGTIKLSQGHNVRAHIYKMWQKLGMIEKHDIL